MCGLVILGLINISSVPGYHGASPTKHICLLHSKNTRGFSASIADGVAYILKFQYLTNTFAWIRRHNEEPPPTPPNAELYQNYLRAVEKEQRSNSQKYGGVNINNNAIQNAQSSPSSSEGDTYVTFLENALFGSPESAETLDHLVVKRNNKGLMQKFLPSIDERRPSEDILRHNVEKVTFYEQNQNCEADDIFVSTYLINSININCMSPDPVCDNFNSCHITPAT